MRVYPQRMTAQNTHRLVSSLATDNATLVSPHAKVLYGVDCFNASLLVAGYLKIYDQATAPTSANTPKRTIYLPANARTHMSWPHGIAIANGLGYRLSSQAADSDVGVLAAGSVLALSLDYT